MSTIKIGLTGNYLSGLDYVTEIFKRYKIPVYDSDLIVKFFLYNSEEHIERVRKAIGEKYFKNGILDISTLSGVDKNGVSVFYKVMNALKYDLIKAFELWRRKQNNNTPYVIFKSQILFEFGFNDNMNMSINVYKPINDRANELKATQNMDFIDGYALLENELNERTKNNMSNYTIHNFAGYDSSVEEQIGKIHKSIKGKAYVDYGSQAEYI